jgi:hypothetical protein
MRTFLCVSFGLVRAQLVRGRIIIIRPLLIFRGLAERVTTFGMQCPGRRVVEPLFDRAEPEWPVATTLVVEDATVGKDDGEEGCGPHAGAAEKSLLRSAAVRKSRVSRSSFFLFRCSQAAKRPMDSALTA